MNKDKARKIHTGLYSKVAKEIIDSVIGQLSDGWGENNPANAKWWEFASYEQASDGEVMIIISTESGIRMYDSRYTYNGFYSMSDEEVKQKFAGWIKKTAKMEMNDEKAGNQWKRDSEMELCYLSYEENVTAADAYFVYEKLLGRDNTKRYSEATVLKVLGKKLSDEATKANEIKANKIERLMYDRDQVLKQLAAKKAEDIKKIEDKYRDDYAETIKNYKIDIDRLKAS